MSILLKFPSELFSSDISYSFLEEIAVDEVIFHQSGSVKFIPSDMSITVNVTEQIYQAFRNHEYYYKGRISLPNEPSSPCEVVVKILFGSDEDGYSEALQRYIQEAKFYRDHLCGNKSLYGKGVPKIYGLYEAKLAWGVPNELVDCACMVYQYYGSSKDLLWSTGSGISDFGLQAVKLLFNMHKFGIVHNSLGLDTNITCLDGKPFLTDFSEACKHDCPDKEFELPARLFTIDPDTLGCGELIDFYKELRYQVAPVRFHWYGYDVKYVRIKSLDSIFQHKRRTMLGTRPTVEEQWKYAVNVWKFLCANWSSYHEGEAPEVGDTSFEAYQARCDSEIIYSDDGYRLPEGFNST